MNAFVCILAIVGASTAFKPQSGWQAQGESDGNNGWQVGGTKKGWQPQSNGNGWQGDASPAPDTWQPKPWKTGGVDPQPWQIAPVVPKPWKQVQTTQAPKAWQDGADDSAWAWQGVGQAKGAWQPEPTATAGPVGPWQQQPQTGPWKSAGNGWQNDEENQNGWEQDSDNEVPASGWKPETNGGNAWKVNGGGNQQWQTPATWQVPSTAKPWKIVSSTQGPWQAGPWTASTAKPTKGWKQSSKW